MMPYIPRLLVDYIPNHTTFTKILRGIIRYESPGDGLYPLVVLNPSL